MKYWEITSMQCVPKEGELIDVVQVVFWKRVFSQDGEPVPRIVEISGSQNFAAPDEASFTPYNELTKEQVCGWLDQKIDVNELDAQLDVMMAAAITPSVTQMPLPWKALINTDSVLGDY